MSCNKEHIKHIMLYKFRKGLNASRALNINAVYPNGLNRRTCYRKFIVCLFLLISSEGMKENHFWIELSTEDEKLVLYVNNSRRNQWLNRGEIPVPIPRTGHHPMTVMLSIWRNMRGIIHWNC